MHDTVLVGVIHCMGELCCQLGRLAGWHWCAGEPLLQRPAIHVLQRKIGPAPMLTDLVDLYDVRVLQLGNHFRFRLKTLQQLLAGIVPGQDHFQGNQPVQAFLLRLVDDSHASAADLLQDLEPIGRRLPAAVWVATAVPAARN